MKLLWDNCQSKLSDLDFVFHTRRDSDKRSALEAVCTDLLLAFNKLDSVDGIPPIYCAAEHLVRIPVLSPHDPASLLQNTATLVDKLRNDLSVISSDLASFRPQLAELKFLVNSSCANMSESLCSSMSRLSSEISTIKDAIPQVTTGSECPAHPVLSTKVNNTIKDNVDRSANVILFGLPEGSLVDTRKLVDEISTHLTGSPKDIKDLFRIGKKSGDRCRPTIVKFITVWDKRLLLANKHKLKSFNKNGIFIRPDMSRDERLAAAAKRQSAQSHIKSSLYVPPSHTSAAASVSTVKSSASIAHISTVNSVSLNRNLLSSSVSAPLFSTSPSVRTSENKMTSSVSTPYTSVAASISTSFNKPPASVSVPHNAIATSASSGLPLPVPLPACSSASVATVSSSPLGSTNST